MILHRNLAALGSNVIDDARSHIVMIFVCCLWLSLFEPFVRSII